ncbi:MAG: hypothetical protein HUN04_03965 [Desulfobacter sp.]|nr:MAG: hypothetical protein HUN04_03965 [Desulfobacter sp.]
MNKVDSANWYCCQIVLKKILVVGIFSFLFCLTSILYSLFLDKYYQASVTLCPPKLETIDSPEIEGLLSYIGFSYNSANAIFVDVKRNVQSVAFLQKFSGENQIPFDSRLKMVHLGSLGIGSFQGKSIFVKYSMPSRNSFDSKIHISIVGTDQKDIKNTLKRFVDFLNSYTIEQKLISNLVRERSAVSDLVRKKTAGLKKEIVVLQKEIKLSEIIHGKNQPSIFLQSQRVEMLNSLVQMLEQELQLIENHIYLFNDWHEFSGEIKKQTTLLKDLEISESKLRAFVTDGDIFVSTRPVAPSIIKYAFWGFWAGFFISAILLLSIEIKRRWSKLNQ